MRFGSLVCHTKNVSLLVKPENANVEMDGNYKIIIGGLESFMDLVCAGLTTMKLMHFG